jgi:hypothetical protein
MESQRFQYPCKWGNNAIREVLGLGLHNTVLSWDGIYEAVNQKVVNQKSVGFRFTKIFSLSSRLAENNGMREL